MNELDYISFFKAHTGYAPYEYQIKIAKLLFEGKNVILSVSTGAGKTLATIIPFLYALINSAIIFPPKMIYSSPLRTLTNSIHFDIKKILGKNENFKNLSSIQTGEYSNDKYFEERIVFSTIDQTLSNFLCFPLPLSQRQANINAGAIIGSYLVFDEFHLLDPKLSMATSLGVIRLLDRLNRVCIMTATLSDEYLNFIKQTFNFEIVSIKDFPQDVGKILSLKPKAGKAVKKNIHVVTDKKINADDILQYHTNKTIVLCNRVENVQKIYNELKGKISDGTILLCIHSRLFLSDRKEKEQQIKTHFGKDSKTQNVILVATQVIEAGMDISCDTLHTEISPVNSFLQRAGRCARFEGEYGEVFVYDVLDLDEKEKLTIEVEDDADKAEIGALNNRYLPYDKELCQKTLSILPKYSFLDEKNATELVNEVLGDKEKSIVKHLKQLNYNICKIESSWSECKKNMYRNTIRDIQSVELILIDIESNRNKNVVPWKYETINVYRWSFISWAKKIEDENRNLENWIFAKAKPASDSVFDFEWADKGSFKLEKMNADDIKNYYEYPIFVDVRYFGYSDAGLMMIPSDENKVSPEKPQEEKESRMITYKKDTYYQHNKGLLNCFELEFEPYLNYLFSALSKYWGVEIDWHRMMQLILCMHDYGKLNDAWQKPMHKFQKRKSEANKDSSYNPDEFLAHTDYNEDTDKELAKECQLKSKPAHAGIGAIAVFELLNTSFGEEIAKSVSCAILKHHSTETESFDSFSITNEGVNEVKKLLKDIDVHDNLISRKRGSTLKDRLPNSYTNKKEWITYLIFVRILRLCDQKATENLEKYYAYECV